MKITSVKEDHAREVLSLMEMAGMEEISGINLRDLKEDELTQSVSDSELGRDALLLAWVGDELVGYVSLDVFYDDFFSGDARSFFVSGLFVHPRHRRRRIGTKLIECAAELASARGFSRMYAEVNVGNHPMLKLIRKAGWTIKSSSFLFEQVDSLEGFSNLGHYVKKLGLRMQICLHGRKADIDCPKLGELKGVFIGPAKEDEINGLLKLGYSENAVLAASKGMAVVAKKGGKIIGACVSFAGRIDHIFGPPKGNIRERMILDAIGSLHPEIKEFFVICSDPSLAGRVALLGLKVTSIFIDVEGEVIEKVMSLLEGLSLGPTTTRYVVFKELNGGR